MSQILYSNYPANSIYSIKAMNDIEQFKAQTDKRKRKLQVLTGHFYYGMHESLPQKAVYCTLLRDPVERIISHYHYVLNTPNHYLYQRVTSSRYTLRDYVANGLSTELNNGQSRLLYGKEGVMAPFGKCPNDLLDRVIQHIDDEFAVVGLQEQFEMSVQLMARMFGWRSSPIMKINVSKNRQQVSDVDRETIELIREYNAVDVALYEYAKQKFQAALQI